jgi:outer membrane protein assembly factor BamB
MQNGPRTQMYVGSSANKMFAVHGETGGVLWSFPTGLAGDVWSTPAVASDGGIVFGSDNNRLTKLGPDGSREWDFETGGDVKSSPAIAPDGSIVFGSMDGRVYCVRSDGTPRWEYRTGGPVRSSPALALDGTVYVGSDDDHLYALSLSDGARRWATELDDRDVQSTPAIGPDGRIYVGSDANTLFALDASTGDILWRFTTPRGDVKSSPAISPNGTLYVGSDDGRLYAVNPDGTKKWEFDTNDDITASPTLGADGTIYVGSSNERLYALEDRGDHPEVLFAFAMHGDVHWSSPAIGPGGVLLAGSDDNKLVALKAPPAFDSASCHGAASFLSDCECVCDHCLSELNTCVADSGCAFALTCALEFRCRGLDCYTPATCQDVFDAVGGPFGAVSLQMERLEGCIQEQCSNCLQPGGGP